MVETTGTFLQRKRREIAEKEGLEAPLSRAEAARRCGLTYAVYRWMEEKDKVLTPEDIQALSQGLGMPREEILTCLGFCDPFPMFIVEELELTQGRWREIARINSPSEFPDRIVLAPSTKKIRIRKQLGTFG